MPEEIKLTRELVEVVLVTFLSALERYTDENELDGVSMNSSLMTEITCKELGI